ncbi:MAG: hypothetical protein E6K95_07290 [Thaumarchaeota archaeon]|nr:MAG: hypothetical protein E6K95_07290 [Nitrososphaerota archaeon]TLY14554.1 MAG: hypothetical protein E6K86_07775 [Nitrososphaerota archaeon]TMP97320.1 MAG: hypothetical protein E6K99_09030 [Nitrososphaerota archaeon]
MFGSEGRGWTLLRPAFKPLVIYLLAALFWSLFGLLAPTTPLHYKEYSLPVLAIEIGGHLSFGVLAGVFTFDPVLVLVCTGESLLIDADHLPSALNFPVLPRLAHSVFFALFTGVLICYALRREKRPDFRLLLVTIGGVFSHLSYDVLAGNGQFPILSPFYLASFSFPYFSWILFEVGACLANLGVAMRLRQ